MKKVFFLFIVAVLGLSAQHEFKPLPYAYDALEPYIDAQTMQIHYEKHHKNYYNNFISCYEKFPELKQMSMIEIFKNIEKFGPKVRNNGGGYWNHEFFWDCMIPGGKAIPTGEFSALFLKTFGTLEDFKKEFKEKALNLFGSGWVWLILDKNKQLKIVTTPNQDNPYMNISSEQGIPLLALDLWEHAYYLKYQNRRGDYIDNFFNVINWEKVAENYKSASRK
jgi:Fe-Mn family superoxide dismutase